MFEEKQAKERILRERQQQQQQEQFFKQFQGEVTIISKVEIMVKDNKLHLQNIHSSPKKKTIKQDFKYIPKASEKEIRKSFLNLIKSIIQMKHLTYQMVKK